MSDSDVSVTIGDDFVATVELRRPPNNHISVPMVDALIAAWAELDADPRCRAIVLCSEGKHFCAGGDFRPDGGGTEITAAGAARSVYDDADQLFSNRKPIVAAVQGAAVGAGLGLAMPADFRVAAPEARFSANFARLGFHHGFVLTATLPRAIGHQKSLDLLYTGRRVKGDEAVAMGLADRLAPLSEVRDAAHAFAREIATSAPLAVESIRETMRGDLPELVRAVRGREQSEQARLRQTHDWEEGVRAMAERRTPDFTRS
jgi:enoyl-CoA hydratase/carnithine racemase